MKTLLLIVGDLTGPPEFSELDFYDSVVRNFKDLYNFRLLVRPKESEAVSAILMADALILFAHGSAGNVYLNQSEVLSKDDLSAKLYRKSFDFVWVAACHTLNDPGWTKMWLSHTDRLVGFKSVTFGKGASDPVLKYSDGTETEVKSPGFRDWYPHPRHIWPERHPNGFFRLLDLWKWPIAIALVGIALLVYWLLR